MNILSQFSLKWAVSFPTLLLIVLAGTILGSSTYYFSRIHALNQEFEERFHELDALRKIHDHSMSMRHMLMEENLQENPGQSRLRFNQHQQKMQVLIEKLAQMSIIDSGEQGILKGIREKTAALTNAIALLLDEPSKKQRKQQTRFILENHFEPLLSYINGWYEYELKEVEVSSNASRENLSHFVISMSILSLILFFILVFIFIFYHRKFTLRIMKIRFGTRELSKGNLTYRFAIDGKDELSQVAMDINEMASSLAIYRDKLNKIAKTDTLTGIMNRRAMDEIMSHEMARSLRSGNHYAILLLDIDHFKKINDTYGHAVGDAVLVHITEMLGNLIRQSDYVFRLGGEEFVIFMPDCPAGEALRSAERIRQGIEHSIFQDENFSISVTASIGVLESTGTDHGIDQMLRYADEAMYQAKEQGRNRCYRYQPPGTEQPL